jgi:hypothetical protein
MVSLAKAWLATLAGQWDEGLINGIHALWYLSAIALVYLLLRRHVALPWALLGTYGFISLPLYLIQGLNAYGDVCLSVHLFAAIFLLFEAGMAQKPQQALSFLRLSAFAGALLPFTKNEALLLYLPPLLLLMTVCVWHLWHAHKLTIRQSLQSIVWQIVFVLLILGPWLGYKWANGLSFGNAKSVASFDIGWQENVLQAIYINTFFEGNWLLLFPLFLFLLVLRWRHAFSWPVLTLTAYALVVYFGQFSLYLFTSLSTEALLQTGYARGIVHLMPIFVCLTGLLLADVFEKKNDGSS